MPKNNEACNLFFLKPQPQENCEEACFLFRALPSEVQALNRRAQEGKEFPGSSKSICGSCVARGKIEAALEKKRDELLQLS